MGVDVKGSGSKYDKNLEGEKRTKVWEMPHSTHLSERLLSAKRALGSGNVTVTEV